MIRFTILTLALLCSAFAVSLLQGCSEAALSESSVPGTYALDTDAMKAAMQAEIDQIEDEMARGVASMALKRFDRMSATVTLNEDGTANSEESRGGEPTLATGTWTLDGDTITITMAAEGGEPRSMSGSIDGDTMRLSADDENADMPFELVFIRQAS